MSIEAAEEISRGAELTEVPEVSRGFVRQAVRDTLSSRTARAGLAWLSLLLVFAVFGPLIANSHPLLMKCAGSWSSPMLRGLTPSDALVFLAFFASAILAVGRWFAFPISLAVVVALVLVAAGPAFAWVRPPENQDYSAWRTLAAEGKIESVLYAPIPYSPSDRLRDQVNARLLPPSRTHWLGTDGNGADIASNIIHAARVALSVGFMATGISVVIGVVIGGLMGYYAALPDLLGMRLIEVFEAIPRLFLLITITAFVEHRNIYLMMLVIGITGWTGYARFLRGEFFTLRKLDYVQAGIAAGLPRRSILFRHMLPNGITPILVSTTFGVASAILYEAVLSFLGLGLVDEPSWGALLNQARAGGLGFIWWIALFPGLAIFLTVFSYNLIGEAVRDALDPKLQKR
jgi:peptide/nickel transport system permease protein